MADVMVGIDGGGSSVRVRATRDGFVVFDASGGPVNIAADPAVWSASLLDATDGCPPADRVAACLAGWSVAEGRKAVRHLLNRRFPGARVRVSPDHLAVMLSAEGSFDLFCLAGTGSRCCSVAAGGEVAVSGGRGLLLGDEGSAARLGRGVLRQVLDPPGAQAPAVARDAVVAVLGTDDPGELVHRVLSAGAPAAELARLAPTLTAAAERREHWAEAVLTIEMHALAAQAAAHVGRHCHSPARTGVLRVGLAGGVWTSAVARSVFATDLRRRLVPLVVQLDRVHTEPVTGALVLAAMTEQEASRLGY